MRLPKHNTIVAYLALFAALGGTSYAAVSLNANSVSSREIKNSSVHRVDLSKGVRAQLNRSTRAHTAQVVEDVLTDPATQINLHVVGEKGDKGDPGDKGDQGPMGVTGAVIRQATVPVPGQTAVGIAVPCEKGERALGGGGRLDATASGQLQASMPDDAGNGWTVLIYNAENGIEHQGIVYAICAPAAQ